MVCAGCGHMVWREDGRCRPCSLAVGHSDPESMHLPAVRTRTTVKEIRRFPMEAFVVHDSVISRVPDDSIQRLDVSWIQPVNGFCRSCERYDCLIFKAEQQRILRSRLMRPREYRQHMVLSNDAPTFVLDYVKDLA